MQFKAAILLSSTAGAIGAAALTAFLLTMPKPASGGPPPDGPLIAIDAPTHARDRLHTVPRLPPGSDAGGDHLAATLSAASVR